MMIEDRSTVRLKRKTAQRYSVLWSQSDPGQAPEGYHYDRLSRFLPAGHLRGWVLDAGCGDGIDTLRMAQRCHGSVVSVDLSPGGVALTKRRTQHLTNVQVLRADVERLPLASGQFDFVYSYGVLHHVPDTAAGIRACARVLKPGAPFLLYLYYAFDNRPAWFRLLWRFSDLIRRAVSRLPFGARARIADLVAVLVYWPLSRLARLGERLGAQVDGWPLSAYRRRGFYVLRTDALDRFGTRLEQRFTRAQIADMLTAAGFGDIRFRDGPPYWCALAVRQNAK